MKKLKKKKKAAILLSFVLVWSLFFALLLLREEKPFPYYGAMVDAAERMDRAMAEIRAEKARRGITLEEADRRETGLIGPEISAIVTTLGSLEAKRTAADPDMAALCVRLYHEAGLKAGDTLGLCMSGSFPGLVLASLCAADAMGLEVRYVCSVGASTYGATNEDFTLPEMLLHLQQGGFLSTAPAAVTWGGESDAGLNMIGRLMGETESYPLIEARLKALGYELPGAMEYAEEISLRQEIYGEIDAFISVGGHLASTGRDGQAYDLGEGLLSSQYVRVTERSGLVERYLAAGTPTISLVNVKKLCLTYGMSFDSPQQSAIGTSSVYFRKRVF